MNRIKINDRFGVLVVKNIVEDIYYCSCLAHPNNKPTQLTSEQLQNAIRCFSCAADAMNNKHQNLTGQTFGQYVAIKCTGLSPRAAKVRQNQRQWRGTAKLDYNTYCRHKYWLCYCIYCHATRRLRVDTLRSGKLPKCICKGTT